MQTYVKLKLILCSIFVNFMNIINCLHFASFLIRSKIRLFNEENAVKLVLSNWVH
jgi:hypothetical protein